MPRNIEIKARLWDRGRVEARLREMGCGVAEIIPQHDIFFASSMGRLKLRIFDPQRGELIAYDRANQATAKLSRYILAPTSDPESLHRALTAALGEIGEVKKTRTLYLIGQTRVHLDKVEGLGDFIELEVVLRDEQSAAEGERIANEIMQMLGIRVEDLIENAYVDMMKG